MDWNYNIELKVDLPTTASGLVGNTQLPMTDPIRPGIVEGGVSFECKTKPAILDTDGCFCEAKNIQQSGPRVTVQVNTEAYDVVAFVSRYIGDVIAHLPDDITSNLNFPLLQVVQTPKVTIVPIIDFRPDGQCFNVRIRVKADFRPGKYKIPAFQAGPARFGPYEFSIGEESTSTFRAQYRICCCTWVWQEDPTHNDAGQEALLEYELNTGDRFVPDEPAVIRYPGVSNLQCDCTDYSVSFLSVEASGSRTMSWKINALEKKCKRVEGSVVDANDVGTGPFKCTQMEDLEESVPHEAVGEGTGGEDGGGDGDAGGGADGQVGQWPVHVTPIGTKDKEPCCCQSCVFEVRLQRFRYLEGMSTCGDHWAELSFVSHIDGNAFIYPASNCSYIRIDKRNESYRKGWIPLNYRVGNLEVSCDCVRKIDIMTEMLENPQIVQRKSASLEGCRPWGVSGVDVVTLRCGNKPEPILQTVQLESAGNSEEGLKAEVEYRISQVTVCSCCGDE